VKTSSGRVVEQSNSYEITEIYRTEILNIGLNRLTLLLHQHACYQSASEWHHV